MPVRYILSSVWVRLSIFSQLSIIQYMGLCLFSLPISCVMIERIYILCLIVIMKSEVWTIIHCSWLGHETMVYALCLSIFLFILKQQFLYILYIPTMALLKVLADSDCSCPSSTKTGSLGEISTVYEYVYRYLVHVHIQNWFTILTQVFNNLLALAKTHQNVCKNIQRVARLT